MATEPTTEPGTDDTNPQGGGGTDTLPDAKTTPTGDPAKDTPQDKDKETPPETDKGDPKGFVEGLPEDLRGNEAFKEMKGVEDLAKAYLDAKGKLPEVPDKADGYKIQVPKDAPVDDEMLGAFKEFALAQGFSGKQAQELVNFQLARVAAETEAFNKYLEGNEKALKDDWGADFDKHVDLAKRVLRRFADSKEELAAFEDWQQKSGMGSYAPLLRLLRNVGAKISEDTLAEAEPAGGARQDGPERTPGGTPMLPFTSMD